jgi:hypothetical protein
MSGAADGAEPSLILQLQKQLQIMNQSVQGMRQFIGQRLDHVQR